MADIEDIIRDAQKFFTSEEFLNPVEDILVVAKVIAAIAIVLLIIDYILLGIQTGFYRNFYLANIKGGPSISLPEGKLKKRWRKVKENAQSNNPSAYKLAVMEGDKLFEHILDMGGFKGENYEERLANVNDGQVVNIEEIRKAHKVRLYIVEDANYVLSHEEAKEIIGQYEKALLDLDIHI